MTARARALSGTVLPVLLVGTCLAGALLAPAAAAAAAAEAPEGVACEALARADFQGLPGAPTTITRATVVPAGDGLPAHCRVEGFVAPQVQFNLRLPADWNGKFLMQGCGGLCGQVQPATCDDVLARNYAVVVTDMGHQAQPWQSAWAWNNLPAEIDFAYRATHVVAVAAKAVIARHYGRGPARSYFQGCSTGGRQGLVAAQRFPADFDGIIAGAPVISETGVAALHLIWSGRANLDAEGRPVLTAAKLALVGEQVMAACDGLDGLRDGVMENPADCQWQPADLACPPDLAPGDPSRCLSAAEQAVLTRLYDGARNSRGERLFDGGLARGSEAEWVPNFVGPGGQPALFHPDGPIRELYQYLIFMPDPGPGPTAAAFDFDRDPPRLALVETLYSAMNPDLAAFRRRGGKLIVYQGWNDIEIPPALTLNWFATMERTMGGRGETAAFARLFMMPGVAHCRRGPGADTVDWLSYLERWVEEGEAPEEVTAFHLRKEQNYLGLPRTRFPLPAADYDRARPLYPWPAEGRYRGRGDPALPRNWRRVSP